MKSAFVLLLVLIGLVLSSCSIPTVQIKAPYQVKERISLGFQKVVIYQIADSLSSFSQQRYVPYFRFDLLNEKGELQQQYIGAMQEYLSRVAGTLRPEQKQLLQASPLNSKKDDQLNLITTWAYPNYDGEISNISESGTVIRTRYWSIDSIGATKTSEIYTTRAVSTPYNGSKLDMNRSREEIRKINQEAEDYVYYDFKSFILNLFRTQ